MRPEGETYLHVLFSDILHVGPNISMNPYTVDELRQLSICKSLHASNCPLVSRMLPHKNGVPSAYVKARWLI
jgi:hypothetical protein